MRRTTWAMALLAMALLQSAVLAQKAPREQAYCYFDEKTLTWRLGNDAVERTIHFDRAVGSLRTTHVAMKVRGAAMASVSNSDAEFAVTPDGGKPATLRLDRDWDYMFQIVAKAESGARILTIHLQGKGRNAGFEVEAAYAIDEGHRARLFDKLLLVNRTAQPVTVDSVLIGRWVLLDPVAGRPVTEGAHLVGGAAKGSAAIGVGEIGPRLLATVERGDEGGSPAVVDGEVTLQQNALVLAWHPGVAIEPGKRWASPRASVWAQPGETKKRLARP